MKTISPVFRMVAALTLPFLLLNCHQEHELSPGSYLSPDVKPPARNALDNYIFENYTKPYNIEVVYQWTESLVDKSQFLYPPMIDSVQPALEIVKKLWVEPYLSVSPDVLKKAAPRQLVLVGGKNINPSGFVYLGMAEGGKRISLFEVDLLRKNAPVDVLRFIHTILHEYSHILAQTKPFDEENFGYITPWAYTAEWFFMSDMDAWRNGCVSQYSRANIHEDFAEMIAFMLEKGNENWESFINSAQGGSFIRRKEQFIVEYYKSKYDIDFYQLRETVYQALLKLLKLK